MKKLINHPEDVLNEFMRGFSIAHKDLVEYKTDPVHFHRAGGAVQGKVGLISGGGSGHEPLGGGYVGRGMLDAAAPGAFFSSPTPDQILAATQAADGGAGVLHLVLNYTGDILNFEMAAEMAEAEGIEVTSVVIDDDVAVEDSTWTAGRRGVAGAITAMKMTGAATDLGYDLARTTEVCKKINDSMGTMGLALSACTVPTAGKPSFDLADDEIELGIGVHGEPGVKRVKIMPADDITDVLVDAVVKDLKLERGEDVLLFINGLGATPLSEQYILYNHAWDKLDALGVNVTRSQVGNYFTSLEMAGASITIMRLDEELTTLFDAPVHTAGWRAGA
ncbi:dihydroxyacetone kinase subunit DhaK [Propionibacteriaceae bacterium G1746]|uniref:dihydroxyacetone kinase subunit DhaK n=1 Tax=Aestuariimicrobium sp. G57 TaxID=3418485 RepID=UPI003C1AF626